MLKHLEKARECTDFHSFTVVRSSQSVAAKKLSFFSLVSIINVCINCSEKHGVVVKKVPVLLTGSWQGAGYIWDKWTIKYSFFNVLKLFHLLFHAKEEFQFSNSDSLTTKLVVKCVCLWNFVFKFLLYIPHFLPWNIFMKKDCRSNVCCMVK